MLFSFCFIPPPLRSSPYLRGTAPSGLFARCVCLLIFPFGQFARCFSLCANLFRFPSVYGLSGWCCSPKVGELRVAVRGMSLRSLERCYKFLTYPLRFARPPTLGGQLHPVCSHAAFACLYSHPACLHAAFANLNPHPVCSHAAFSYLQTYSVSLSLRTIRTVLLP